MRSLAARRGLRRLRIGMIYGFLALFILALVLGAVFSAWPATLLGAATGVAFMGMSWLTSSATLKAEDPSVLWVGVDYVVKLLVAVGVLVLAKQLDIFDPVVVAILVIVGIAVGTGVQVWAFAPEKRPVPTEVEE